MGAIKESVTGLQDLAFETADLFDKRIDVTLRGQQIVMVAESGEAVTIIPVSDASLDIVMAASLSAQRHGIHGAYADLDEYGLCDLVEAAIRGGYDYIYIKV